MAVTASGFFCQTELKQSDGTDVVIDWINDTIKHALFPNTITPDFDNDVGYGTHSASESSGTGYTAGGLAASGKTITVVSGSVKWDCDDPSWSGLTISGVRAMLTFDDTVTSDRGLALVNLAADYGVVAGTLLIQLATNGLFLTDNTP